MKFIKVTEIVETRLIDDIYINPRFIRSMREGMQTAEHRDSETVTILEFDNGSVICVKEKKEDIYFSIFE